MLGDEYYDDSFENLMKFLPPLTEDMVNTLNACIVKDPQRTDIIREYIDFLHERICDIIREFWDKIKIDTISLLKFAQWINTYNE